MLYVYLLDILGSTYTFIHAINKSKSIFLNNEKSMKTLFTISIFDILYKSNKVILVFFILVLINLTGKYYNNTGLHHVFCFSRRTHFSPHKSLPCKESSDFQNYNAISFLFALNYGQIGMGWVGAYKVELYWYASAVFQHSISPNLIKASREPQWGLFAFKQCKGQRSGINWTAALHQTFLLIFQSFFLSSNLTCFQ